MGKDFAKRSAPSRSESQQYSTGIVKAANHVIGLFESPDDSRHRVLRKTKIVPELDVARHPQRSSPQIGECLPGRGRAQVGNPEFSWTA